MYVLRQHVKGCTTVCSLFLVVCEHLTRLNYCCCVEVVVSRILAFCLQQYAGHCLGVVIASLRLCLYCLP